MKVLIACEESQAVCAAFRERGHEAYSCDINEYFKNYFPRANGDRRTRQFGCQSYRPRTLCYKYSMGWCRITLYSVNVKKYGRIKSSLSKTKRGEKHNTKN